MKPWPDNWNLLGDVFAHTRNFSEHEEDEYASSSPEVACRGSPASHKLVLEEKICLDLCE